MKSIVTEVSKKEGYQLDAGSIELLAILGDGSFRDVLGILQKVLNFSKNKKINVEEVEKITGSPKTILVNDFISAIVEREIEKGITTVKKASEENLDMKLFLKLIIQKFRVAIILKYAPKLETEMAGELSEADLEFFKKLIKEDRQAGLHSSTLSILLDAYKNIENAFITELPLELALIKILSKEK